MKEFFNKLAKLFESEKFKVAQLADADQTEIQYEGDAIAPGVMLTMKTVDDAGAEQVVPLPEGEHPLGGEYAGKIAVVDATGKVLELKDAQGSQTPPSTGAEPTAEQQAALAEQLFTRMKSTEAELKKTKSEFDAFKKSVIDGKVEKGKFVFSGSTEQHKKSTQEKTSKLI